MANGRRRPARAMIVQRTTSLQGRYVSGHPRNDALGWNSDASLEAMPGKQPAAKGGRDFAKAAAAPPTKAKARSKQKQATGEAPSGATSTPSLPESKVRRNPLALEEWLFTHVKKRLKWKDAIARQCLHEMARSESAFCGMELYLVWEGYLAQLTRKRPSDAEESRRVLEEVLRFFESRAKFVSPKQIELQSRGELKRGKRSKKSARRRSTKSQAKKRRS